MTQHLLYRLEEAWLDVPTTCLFKEIRRRLPRELGTAWVRKKGPNLRRSG